MVVLDGAGADSLAVVLDAASPARLRPPDSTEIAHLAFTAGTTGRPKPLALSNRNVLASARAVLRAWRWRQHDSLVHSLPLQHGHGMGALAACKRPKEYRIISRLPRNHMGKVMRSALVATDQG